MGRSRFADEESDNDIVPPETSIENEPGGFVRGEVDVLDQMSRTERRMRYAATSPLKRGVRDEDLEKRPDDERPQASLDDLIGSTNV